MIDEDVILAIRQTKTVVPPPFWQPVGAYQECRMPVNVDGIGLQGMFVRIKVPDTVDAYGTMVQLEWDRKLGKTLPLERVEWKVGHTNKNKGPHHLRLAVMDTTHIHRFEHNHLPDDGRMLERNLPIAEPVDCDPETLQEFFQRCETWLKIEGLALLERPPFQSTLPF